MANDCEMSHLVHHSAPWWTGILLHLCTTGFVNQQHIVEIVINIFTDTEDIKSTDKGYWIS